MLVNYWISSISPEGRLLLAFNKEFQLNNRTDKDGVDGRRLKEDGLKIYTRKNTDYEV
jgi:hypothetical protein